MTPRHRLKAIAALGLMGTGLAAAHALKPTRHLADMVARPKLPQLFPETFEGWAIDRTGPVQLVSPDAEALLNKLYNETLSRVYLGPERARIMLSVAYGGDQSDGTRAHRPDVCYPAQGFQLQSSRDATVATAAHAIPVRQLVATLGNRIEPITYWIVVGDRIALSGPQQKMAQLSYSLRGIVPDGMLVRVSNISPDLEASFALHGRFVRALTAALTPEHLRLVVGTAGSVA